ncbi:DUF4278 domain-containing protein [Prochlorothrix hollandica]|uniref:DUF4278 domain-containing protein n=1 Tax=Prochlorothrix hollandica TaxID=1223 RepID=UPI0009D9920E|nr:DUF4278 domain-containing protein [Prochlorothrix hollandica]
MHMTYRGVSYEPNAPHIELKEEQVVGHYRGRELHFRTLLNNPVLQPAFHLVYRGIG